MHLKSMASAAAIAASIGMAGLSIAVVPAYADPPPCNQPNCQGGPGPHGPSGPPQQQGPNQQFNGPQQQGPNQQFNGPQQQGPNQQGGPRNTPGGWRSPGQGAT
jgi:hypothetical protein